MELSIIIPTYNRKEVLKQCLSSLKNQGLDGYKYEVIVCDDGSNDGTLKMLNTLFNTKLPFSLEYKHQEKKGFRAAAARNMGLKIAKSENILFLDHDIICEQRILPIFLNRVDDGTFCCGIKKLISSEFYHHIDFSSLSKEWFGVVTATLSSFGIIKKKDIDKVGHFDEDFNVYGLEDTEFTDRLTDIGVIWNVEPKCVGYHIEHEKCLLSKKAQDIYQAKRKK